MVMRTCVNARMSATLAMSRLRSSRVLLLAILQLFVEGADRADTLFSFLFALELKRHRNFFKLVPLERKLIAALRLAIEHVEHSFLILQYPLIILCLLWYPVVECDDFCRRLPRGDLDKIVHEEATL